MVFPTVRKARSEGVFLMVIRHDIQLMRVVWMVQVVIQVGCSCCTDMYVD
jgi:hypothetical protein